MGKYAALARRGSALGLLWLSACVAVEEPRGTALDAAAWGRERAEFTTRLAFEAVQRGEPSRAQQLLEDALGQDPRYVPALALRTRLAHETGDIASGLHHAAAWRAVAPSDAQALRLQGLLTDAAGRHDEAEALLQEARVGAPDDPRAGFDLYLHYLSRGREAEAERVLATLGSSRADAAPLVQGAAWYLEQGRGEQALAAYREARRRAPDDHSVAGHLAIGAWSLGQPAEVLEIGEQLPPRARLEQPVLPLVLASARLERGDRKGALKELDLVPAEARDAAYRAFRGEVLLALGAAEEARVELASATEAEAEAPSRVWFSLGKASLQCGFASEALRALRQAERLGESSAQLLALIAAAQHALGAGAAARESLERARRAGADAAVLREVEELLAEERGR
ncbi:MAG: tetratricopeptide repeat protein [Planctomycetes bacterium]|nr:tetratricopeptide repeat protein [Planctomycetota bacterium]